jgi:hypothetical protein
MDSHSPFNSTGAVMAIVVGHRTFGRKSSFPLDDRAFPLGIGR